MRADLLAGLTLSIQHQQQHQDDETTANAVVMPFQYERPVHHNLRIPTVQHIYTYVSNMSTVPARPRFHAIYPPNETNSTAHSSKSLRSLTQRIS